MPTRTKTEGGFQRSQGRWFYYGFPEYSESQSSPWNVLSTVTYGSNVIDWQRRIAAGLQAGTPLLGIDRKPGYIVSSQSYDKQITPPSQFSPGEGVGGSWTSSRPWMPNASSYSLSETDAYDACVIGFLEQVKGVSQKFSSGTFVGELGQTLRMLRRPFHTLTRRLTSYVETVQKRTRTIRKGSLAEKRRKRQKVVSETWLEYSFGLVPLQHDINDATNALISLSHAKPAWERVSYTKVKDTELSRYTISPAVYNHLNVSFNIVETEKLVVKLIGAVSVDATRQGKFDAFGLNIQDFAPTIWELIPYSFLVDYFANVGGLISALTTRQSNVRWKMLTKVREISARPISKNRQWALSGQSHPYFWKWVEQSSCTEAKLRTVERSPWDILLAPQLVFRIPHSGTKWLNMAALFRTSRGLESRLR